MRSVSAIKKKYGTTAFKKWGKQGGNPLLIAQGRGYRITVHKNSRR